MAPRPPIAVGRRFVSLALFCVAVILLFPPLVLACGLLRRFDSSDFVGLITLTILVAYPVLILLALAAVVRWHRSPPKR